MTESVFSPESVGGRHLGAEPIDNNELFERFTEAVSTAGKGDQISIATLCFDPGEAITAELAFELLEALGRGANVQVATDHFGHLLAHQVGMVAAAWLTDPEGLARRQEVQRALEIAGADVRIINQDTSPLAPLFRIRGRSHLKILAIRGSSRNMGYVAGPNLFDAMRLDAGVELHHPDAIEMLHDTVTSLVQTGTTQAAFQGKDQRLKLPHGGELLLDAGEPGQSVIMDEALAMIDSAEESITMTTQYAPHGALIRHAHAAEKRGVKLNMLCSISNVRMERVIFGAMRAVNRLIYSDAAAGYCIPEGMPELHANILLIDAGIVGKQVATVGSHNHSSIGVRGGNAELSYRSSDPDFIAKIGEIVLKLTTRPVASRA